MFVALNGAGAVDEWVARPCALQFVRTESMSEATVLLSETTKNVLFVLFEENVASASGPPGRLVLSGRPYWGRGVRPCESDRGRVLYLPAVQVVRPVEGRAPDDRPE